LTAEDVKFTFGRYKGYGAKELKEKVKQVEVADPYTVRFILAAPWPDFMEKYTECHIDWSQLDTPKNYIEKVGMPVSPRTLLAPVLIKWSVGAG